ncbi:MAG: PQQ-like beta-propeller repeat protein, partial [Planctomycetes bacterium]|nr:PQQ-like beta-propeller repeat protein [Planctomycetota bacterium]
AAPAPAVLDLSIQDAPPPPPPPSSASSPLPVADSAPALPPSPAPLPSSNQAPASPVVPVSPLPATPAAQVPSGHASGPQAAYASGPQRSVGRTSGPQKSQASSSSSSRRASSAPLSSQSASHESGIRRGKNADKVRERMANAQTDMHQRVTEMTNKGDVYNAAGKYKKAIKIWEKASQATTDVKTRELCYGKIRIAKLFIAQQRKRRAMWSMVIVLPLLIAAVYVGTPVAHEMYLQHEINTIKTSGLHEDAQKSRWKRLAAYGKPFEWYNTVFVGQTYELPSAAEIVQNLKAFKIIDQQMNQSSTGTDGAKKRRTPADISELEAILVDDNISWYEVAAAAKSMMPKLKDQKLLQKVNDIAAEARGHVTTIERDLDAIQEKLKQGDFTEAESIALDLSQREARGGEAMANLPKQIQLIVKDESGNMVQGAAVSINAVRIRGEYRAYSLARDKVHLEISHGDYQTFVSDIPAATKTFTVTLRASSQWSSDCGNGTGAWVQLIAATADYFLINNGEKLSAYSMADGHALGSIKRSDVNKAKGLGLSRWENAAQVIRESIYIGSSDGLLLELGLDRSEKQFSINKVVYEGNHSVLSFVEYDLVFRSGTTKALTIRRDKTAELHGLINGQDSWQFKNLSAQFDPQLFYKNEMLYVLDDNRFYVFDEGGAKKEHVPLPQPRSGRAAWINSDVLAYPHEQGVALIKFKDDSYRMARGIAMNSAPVGAVCSDGERVFVACDDAQLRCLSFNEGLLYEEWSAKLAAGAQYAFAPQCAQGIVCAVDNHGGIYCYHARSGELLNKIEHGEQLVSAPMLSFDRIIFLDVAQKITSYRLPAAP